MWAFGVFNSGSNLLLNFRDGWAIRIYLIVSAATGYLPLTFGQILLFLKAELRWKVGGVRCEKQNWLTASVQCAVWVCVWLSCAQTVCTLEPL